MINSFIMILFILFLTSITLAFIVLYTKYKSALENLHKLNETIDRSKKNIEILSLKANTDKLTSVYNRDYLENFLSSTSDLNLPENETSMIMADLDNLKVINDVYGHIHGDMALSTFSSVLLSCTRKSDIVARYGGDEFVIVLPNTSSEVALHIAQRILTALQQASIKDLNNHLNEIVLTCSLGISTYPSLCTNTNELLITADKALYNAKALGKNTASVYRVACL